MHVCVLLLQQSPSLCDPVDCNPPGSFIHGILRYWSVFLQGACPTWGSTYTSSVSRIGRHVLYHQCHLGSLAYRINFVNFLLHFKECMIETSLLPLAYAMTFTQSKFYLFNRLHL